MSGFGAYHGPPPAIITYMSGKHSFDCFSHKKPVLIKATWSDFGLLTDPFFLYPPWTPLKIKILRALAKFM